MTLSIPTRTKPGSNSFPTTPETVRSWLSTLHPIESSDAVLTLYRGLKHSNRLEIANHLRLEIANQFQPAVDMAVDLLRNLFVDQALPLAGRQLAAFRLSQDLLRELAYAYQIVVNDTYATLLPGQTKSRSYGIFHSLQAIARQVESHLLIYSPIEPKLLQTANELFEFAVSSRLESAPIVGTAEDEQHLSIQGLYVYIQLLGLAKTSNQRRNQIPILCRFLHDLCTQIRVHESSSTEYDSRYAVGICQNQDSPAQPLIYIDKPLLLDARVMDISPIIDTIDEVVDSLPGSASQVLEPETLLRSALLKLRETCHRTTTRRVGRAFASRPVDVSLGWLSVMANLQFSDDADLSQQLDDSDLSDLLVDTPEPAPESRPNGKLATIDCWPVPPDQQSWYLTNDSEYGAGLEWRGTQPTDADIGGLVLLQDQEGPALTSHVGITRWIINSETGCLRLGVEFVGEQARVIDMTPKVSPSRQKEQKPISVLLVSWSQRQKTSDEPTNSTSPQQTRMILPVSAASEWLPDTVLIAPDGVEWSVAESLETGAQVEVFQLRRM